MKLKAFTLQLDADSGLFDDTALCAFLAERDAIAVDQHFFVHEGVPRWALLVQYRAMVRPERARHLDDEQPDWRADLSGDEATLFSALRNWRNNRARRDGRPAFVLFTNRQIGEIAKLRPHTLAELATISGVGEARVRDYGESVLAVVRGADPQRSSGAPGAIDPAPAIDDGPPAAPSPASVDAASAVEVP